MTFIENIEEVCPVCGKGETERVATGDIEKWCTVAVSHFQCTKKMHWMFHHEILSWSYPNDDEMSVHTCNWMDEYVKDLEAAYEKENT